eukprot:2621215-Prymnesium_polylepis.2
MEVGAAAFEPTPSAMPLMAEFHDFCEECGLETKEVSFGTEEPNGGRPLSMTNTARADALSSLTAETRNSKASTVASLLAQT